MSTKRFVQVEVFAPSGETRIWRAVDRDTLSAHEPPRMEVSFESDSEDGHCQVRATGMPFLIVSPSGSDAIREGLDCILGPQFAQLLLDDIEYAVRDLVGTVVTEAVASTWSAKLAASMAENIRALFDGDENETPKGGNEK